MSTESKWIYRKVTMSQALAWADGKQVVEKDISAYPGKSEADGVLLDDGSRVLAESSWTGPYSKETPDIDAEAPIFWIGEKS